MSADTRQRSKTAVHFFTDSNGFLVRGTLDPHATLQMALNEDDDLYIDDLLFQVARPRPGVGDAEPTPEAVSAFADTLHTLLAEAKPGLYRLNVAPPGNDDGVTWWLVPADARGRGVFEGVEFE